MAGFGRILLAIDAHRSAPLSAAAHTILSGENTMRDAAINAGRDGSPVPVREVDHLEARYVAG